MVTIQQQTPEQRLEIRNNLLHVLELVKLHPEKELNLKCYKVKTVCGTLYCTLGLICEDPTFQEKGFSLVESGGGNGLQYYEVKINSAQPLDFGKAFLDSLFGENSHQNLFAPFGRGSYDSELTTQVKDLTDKALAIARLKKQISLYE